MTCRRDSPRSPALPPQASTLTPPTRPVDSPKLHCANTIAARCRVARRAIATSRRSRASRESSECVAIRTCGPLACRVYARRSAFRNTGLDCLGRSHFRFLRRPGRAPDELRRRFRPVARQPVRYRLRPDRSGMRGARRRDSRLHTYFDRYLVYSVCNRLANDLRLFHSREEPARSLGRRNQFRPGDYPGILLAATMARHAGARRSTADRDFLSRGDLRAHAQLPPDWRRAGLPMHPRVIATPDPRAAGRAPRDEPPVYVLPRGMTATPRTVSLAASAGTPQLTPKAQLRFRSRRTPADMQGTLARAPGQCPKRSILRCPDGAERASAPAPHDTRFARRLSRSLCRSRRLRSNDERSRVVLLRTATRAFAGHVAPRRVDQAAGIVSVMMASPVAQVVVRTGLVAALRRDVEEDVGAEKHVAAARVAGICMEDAAVLVLVEHAAAGHFLALELLRFVVVVHLALRDFVRRERYVIVVVEIAPVRRHPLEAPAH